MDAKSKTRAKAKPKSAPSAVDAESAADALSDRLTGLLDSVLTAESVPNFLATLNDTLGAENLALVARQMTADGKTVERSFQEWTPTSITVVEPDELKTQSGAEGGVRIGRTADGTEIVLQEVAPRSGGLSRDAAAGLVVRVLKLHRTLIGSQIRSQATSIVLDAVPHGVVLVNGAARVLLTNRAAQQILSLDDGLSVDANGILRTAAPRDTDRLREVVSEVAGATPGAGAQPVGVLKLDRPTLLGSWLMAVIPIHARRRSDTVSEIAAIFVTETSTGEPTGIPPQSIERLFALTPAEARLLVALVDGAGLDEIAQMYDVSKNTLRNQLNQIFRKTGASKQSELVRMVLASPAAMLHRPKFRSPD